MAPAQPPPPPSHPPEQPQKRGMADSTKQFILLGAIILPLAWYPYFRLRGDIAAMSREIFPSFRTMGTKVGESTRLLNKLTTTTSDRFHAVDRRLSGLEEMMLGELARARQYKEALEERQAQRDIRLVNKLAAQVLANRNKS